MQALKEADSHWEGRGKIRGRERKNQVGGNDFQKASLSPSGAHTPLLPLAPLSLSQCACEKTDNCMNIICVSTITVLGLHAAC